MGQWSPIFAGIQVRMGSQRLPRKALLLIQGKTSIQWIAERLKASRELQGIFVATSVTAENDPIERLAKQLGLRCYRGDERDLIQRHLGGTRMVGAEALLRVTADCPFVDPLLADQMIKKYREKGSRFDFITNTFPPTYPDGLDLDILPRRTLERLDNEVKDPLHREWFTTYILKHPMSFRIFNVAHTNNLSHLRWTLDYPEDLLFMRKVLFHFKNRTTPFRMNELLQLLKERPSLGEINENRIDKTIIRGIRSHAYHTLLKKTKLSQESTSE